MKVAIKATKLFLEFNDLLFHIKQNRKRKKLLALIEYIVKLKSETELENVACKV